MKYILFGLVLFVSYSASAWTVESAEGDVWLSGDFGRKPIEIGLALTTDQLIATGKEGRVQLKDGESQVWLSSNTHFKVTELANLAEKKSGMLQILQGKMRARLVKPPDEAEASYKVKMRTVVAGVRGTEFFAAVGTDDEKVCTLEGHVVVSSLASGSTQHSTQQWELPAGKGFFATTGKAPEIKDTSAAQVMNWVSDTSPLNVYSLPWQLRSVNLADALRLDSAFSSFADSSGNPGGTAQAQMLTGTHKLSAQFGLLARVGVVANYPPQSAPSGTSFTNSLVAGEYTPVLDPYFKLLFFFGATLPVGTGSGNTPGAGVKLANSSGILARSAMDNALFAVNYFAVIPGIDAAYIRDSWTADFEATLFQLSRVGGEQVDKDAIRTNLTTGLELGYAFIPSVSVIGELHYQRWLSNDTVFAAATPAVENLSFAIGPRFSFVLGDFTLKPGIAYERGLVGPMVSGGFSSPVNSEQILFVDLPVVF